MEYPDRTFVDQHGREIVVDESLSLKDSILNYGRVRKNLYFHRETKIGDYNEWKAVECDLSNQVKIALENYEASFYRETGFWPCVIEMIDFDPGSFKG